MDSDVFYVKAIVKGTGVNGVPIDYIYVPATYFQINGQPQVDSNFASISAASTQKSSLLLYEPNPDGTGTYVALPASQQNPNGYISLGDTGCKCGNLGQ